MFGFVKLIFISAISLECISINNQEYKVKPQTVNVNSEKRVFFFQY